MCGSCIPAFLALHSFEGLLFFAKKCFLVWVFLPPGRCAFLALVGTSFREVQGSVRCLYVKCNVLAGPAASQRICRCLGCSPVTHTGGCGYGKCRCGHLAELNTRQSRFPFLRPSSRDRKIPHPFALHQQERLQIPLLARICPCARQP